MQQIEKLLERPENSVQNLAFNFSIPLLVNGNTLAHNVHVVTVETAAVETTVLIGA